MQIEERLGLDLTWDEARKKSNIIALNPKC